METAVAEGRAVPATIAIINREIHIDLTSDQVENLAQLDRIRYENVVVVIFPLLLLDKKMERLP